MQTTSQHRLTTPPTTLKMSNTKKTMLVSINYCPDCLICETSALLSNLAANIHELWMDYLNCMWITFVLLEIQIDSKSDSNFPLFSRNRTLNALLRLDAVCCVGLHEFQSNVSLVVLLRSGSHSNRIAVITEIIDHNRVSFSWSEYCLTNDRSPTGHYRRPNDWCPTTVISL